MTDLRGIQRYSIGCHEDSQHYGEVTEAVDGAMVYWDDVAEALSSSEALVKELQAKVDAHSSQMSGIAQRAAEKVSEQLQSELNEMGIGYKPNVEFFKEIISQVSKVERGEE